MVLGRFGWFWVVLGRFGWFRVLVTTIFGYFREISLYRESRYNDLIPLLPWHIVISGFHCNNS